MARSGSSPGVFVAGLTALALAVIGFFAYQASAAQERTGAHKPSPGASASPSPGGKGKDSGGKSDSKEIPAASGSGQRVVYALDSERVWLVNGQGKATRTFRVKPSTVDPRPGTYQVGSRSGQITGSDGIPVEHVVRFANEGDITIGFSAAVNGSTAPPAPGRKTGGIRESREDGDAMWRFATIGTKVVVVP
ncbi:hypothetical protein [Streptomyces sp. ODS28]|uniref:hypothetical protein n=1 Tax=Streptomyces sp. ODS28 TaxID=3136688 RepID=UPI0031ED57CC